MSNFVDKKDYYSSLKSKSDGVYIVNNNEEHLIDFELLEYYLNNYTLTKGFFMNVFRKIECNDGVIRFYGREHQEYKDAKKAEKISVKSLELGEVLKYKNNDVEVIFLGSFYRKRWGNITRVHVFLNERNDRVVVESTLNKFIEVTGYKTGYSDKVENLNKYLIKYLGSIFTITKNGE